jgi:hypothetical protein
MNIWVVKYTCQGTGDHSISIWDTEDNALRYAALSIMDNVMYWNNANDQIDLISKHVAAGNWRDAVIEYNNYDGNADRECFSIYLRPLLTTRYNPSILSPIDPNPKMHVIASKSVICPCGLTRIDCEYHK